MREAVEVMARGKLTKAQVRGLTAAAKSGGVVGFGQHARTIQILRERGLLTVNRDNYGYFNITDAGRAILAAAAQVEG